MTMPEAPLLPAFDAPLLFATTALLTLSPLMNVPWALPQSTT